MKKIALLMLPLLTFLIMVAPAEAKRLTPKQQEAQKVIRTANKYFSNAAFKRVQRNIGRKMSGEIPRCWTSSLRSMPSTTSRPPWYAIDALYFLAYPKHLKTYINNYTRLARDLTRLRLRDATLRKYPTVLRRIASVYKRYAKPNIIRQTNRLAPCAAMKKWIASDWRDPQVRRFGMNYNNMVTVVLKQSAYMKSLRDYIISLGFSAKKVNPTVGP